MNPYKIDLEKLVKEKKTFYIYFRMIIWFLTIYISVYGIALGAMYLLTK